MDTSSTFALPRHVQNASPLVSLPAELRRKIYRYLHVSRNSLEEEYDAGADAEVKYEHDLTLSAQLLSTCQAIFVEAFPILYEENVLEVHVKSSDEDVQIGILDNVIVIPQHLQRDTLESIDLLSLCRRKARKGSAVEHPTYLRLWQGYPNLRRFHSICTEMQFATQRQSAVSVAILKQLLWKKVVLLNVTLRGRTRWDFRAALLALKALRCQVVDLMVLGREKHRKAIVPLARDVRDIISSTEAYRDLSADLLTLERDVFSQLTTSDGLGLFCEAYSNGLEELHEAAECCDYKAFDDAKEDLLEAAIFWKDQYVASVRQTEMTKMNVAQARLDEAEAFGKTIQKAFDSIARTDAIAHEL